MTAPDGTRWTVRRLWLPRRRQRPSVDAVDAHLPEVSFDFEEALVGIVAAAAALLLVLLIVLLLPYVFLVLELLLLPALFAYRIALRKPWTVEARSDGGKRRRWQVVGWRRAGEEAGRIARALERGEKPAAG